MKSSFECTYANLKKKFVSKTCVLSAELLNVVMELLNQLQQNFKWQEEVILVNACQVIHLDGLLLLTNYLSTFAQLPLYYFSTALLKKKENAAFCLIFLKNEFLFETSL